MVDTPHLSIVSDTNETFWDARKDIIHKYRTTLNEDDKNRYKYFPYKAFAYKYPDTMDNVVKQWHSIDGVWKAMESHILEHQEKKKKYDRVAMIRNDVLYVEPIDLYASEKGSNNENDCMLTIPNFANHPVNDRMVIGTYDAVEIWATKRFDRVEYQVNTYTPVGFGIHSERMMSHAILPLIREKYNCTIRQDNNLCFLRVRADGAIWLQDCSNGDSQYKGDVKQRLFDMVNSSLGEQHKNETSLFPNICEKKMLRNNLPQAYCPPFHGTIRDTTDNSTFTAVVNNTQISKETMEYLVNRLWQLYIAYAHSEQKIYNRKEIMYYH